MNYVQRAREFKTKKRLGQNFLVDISTIETIIENANLSKDETVVEIGPGIGFVTEKLAEHAKNVIAVEIDSDAISELNKLDYENIEIVQSDILKTDFSDLVNKPVKIVANIPYYITSPILVHLLGEIDDFHNVNRNLISEIILMVQYEVAKRIVATEKSPNKEFGNLSVLCNYWAETEIIKKVPSNCFFPSPKVDSALVKLKIRKEPLVKPHNPKLFRKVVQACFGTRRKNIKNSLIMGGFKKEIVENVLSIMNIDVSKRGETLSIIEISALSDKIDQIISI